MIVLQYKSKAVVLRSPDLRDTQDHVLGVQRRFDMLGRPHTWVPPVNDKRLLLLTFRGLSRETILDLRDFLILSAGKFIKYIDHSGNSWTGLITSELPTSTAEGANCMDTITLQFEGKKDA